MTTSAAHPANLDKPYTVTLWGSNPDETDNNDCWTGDDFATRDEAIKAYREVVMFPEDSPLAKVCGRGGWEYVMIDGPETHEVTQNPDRPSCRRHRREQAQSARSWQRECAMEAGMLHGINAYNDTMGY